MIEGRMARPTDLHRESHRRRCWRLKRTIDVARPEVRRLDSAQVRPKRIPQRQPWILVLDGVCTHLGCAPTSRFEFAPADLGPQWPGGFYCPCHGSKFDLAGRVFKGVPAPLNLRGAAATASSTTVRSDRRRTRRILNDGQHRSRPATASAARLSASRRWIDERFPLTRS